MLLKPNIKIMLGLNFEFLNGNSVTSLTRLKKVKTKMADINLPCLNSFGFIVECWFGVRIYPQSNAKMMHK